MEKKKRVTLVDLAACCGLSKTAVGAILSHDPKYKVSPETKDMVLALARKMDYKPNLAAKALVSRKHYTVGMLFYSVKDRCYSEIMAAAQQKLAEKGYASLFAFWEDSDFMSAFNMLADHGVDGIITNAPEELAQTLPADMPVVLYGFSSQTRDAVLARCDPEGAGLSLRQRAPRFRLSVQSRAGTALSGVSGFSAFKTPAGASGVDETDGQRYQCQRSGDEGDSRLPELPDRDYCPERCDRHGSHGDCRERRGESSGTDFLCRIR